MTERKSGKQSKSGFTSAPEIVRASFIDGAGVPRVALLPKGETDTAMGIPVSLDISPLYEHMPSAFQAELTTALHAQGLVEAADYFQPGAGDRFRAAMLTVIRHDFSNAQALAKEEISHAR